MTDRGESFNGSGAGFALEEVRRNVELDELAHHLSELARTLEHEENLEDTLGAIVRSAVQTISGARHASVSAVKRRRAVSTLAATDDVASAVDSAQYETAEGPCLDTLYYKRTERLRDMTTETRWPKFTAAAEELGVRSMLAVRLYVLGEDLGALTLHSDRADAFDDESERVALLFAAHAAVAMSAAHEHTHLRTALDSRDLIGQAKGMLMERYKVSSQRAFTLLIQLSQRTNMPLRDLARQLTETGSLEHRPT